LINSTADRQDVTSDEFSLVPQLKPTARRPLHQEAVQLVEFEITKRLKGIAGPVPVLVGQPGSGKTSALRHIYSHQQTLGRIVGTGEVRNGMETAIIAGTRQIIAELGRVNTPRNPTATMVESLTTALSRYLRAFASDLTAEQRMSHNDALMAELADASSRTPNGILLLLDDIDTDDPHEMLAFTDGILALAETGSPLLMLCTSSSDRRDSRWPRSQKPFRMTPSVTDIVELAFALGFDVTREEIVIVAEQCNGNLYEATNRLRAIAFHRNPLAQQNHSVSSQLSPQRSTSQSPRVAPVAPVAPTVPTAPTATTARPATTAPPATTATKETEAFRSLRKSEIRQSLQQRHADNSGSSTTRVQPSWTDKPAGKPTTNTTDQQTDRAVPPPDTTESPFGDAAQIASLRIALAHLTDSEPDKTLRDQTFKRLGN
jgi:hypothetical protein